MNLSRRSVFGQVRHRRMFAFVPHYCLNDRTWRWLEHVDVCEVRGAHTWHIVEYTSIQVIEL